MVILRHSVYQLLGGSEIILFNKLYDHGQVKNKTLIKSLHVINYAKEKSTFVDLTFTLVYS